MTKFRVRIIITKGKKYSATEYKLDIKYLESLKEWILRLK